MRNFTHSPADVASRVLIALNVCGEVGADWPVYVESEPETPDDVVTVYNTQGADGGRSMVDGDLFGSPGVQFRVRGHDSVAAWEKADEIQATIARGVYQRTVHIGDVDYLVHSFNRIGDVLPVGPEPTAPGRSVYTVNALIAVKEL